MGGEGPASSIPLRLVRCCRPYLSPTSEADGCGGGAALAGRGLDRGGGVVAGPGRPGDGPPLGDDGPLAKRNDGVLFLQSPVGVQGGQPPLPCVPAANAATSCSFAVHFLRKP